MSSYEIVLLGDHDSASVAHQTVPQALALAAVEPEDGRAHAGAGSRAARFLGVESVRGSDGLGVTLSYWVDRAAAAAWGAHPEHREAQRLGRELWYLWHVTRVARVLSTRPTEVVTPP